MRAHRHGTHPRHTCTIIHAHTHMCTHACSRKAHPHPYTQRTCLHAHACIRTCTGLRLHAHPLRITHMHSHTYSYTLACTPPSGSHTCIQTRLHAHSLLAHTHAFTHVQVHACMHTPQAHTHAFTHVQVHTCMHTASGLFARTECGFGQSWTLACLVFVEVTLNTPLGF